jgi:hypothetical protein
MTLTDLDHAHRAMLDAPDDDTARLQFFERLADSELFLLLAAEPEGDQITPDLFDVSDGRFATVFDREERLAGFVGDITAPYAALPGRALVQMLEGQGVGLALNPDVAPSAMLIPAAAVDWLAETLRNRPQSQEAQISQVHAPSGLPEALLRGLDRKLAKAAGLARYAVLAGVTYRGGGRGHVLAFLGARDDAHDALALAAGEALTFSGTEAGVIDVIFVRENEPLAMRLAKVGLRFELPQQVKPTPPAAPGMDPARPPRLR